MPESNVNLEKSKLCRIIEENLPGASVVGGPRKFFREELGMEYINQVFALKESSWQKLTLEEDVESVKVAISARCHHHTLATDESYYAISAAAAIIKYII